MLLIWMGIDATDCLFNLVQFNHAKDKIERLK